MLHSENYLETLFLKFPQFEVPDMIRKEPVVSFAYFTDFETSDIASLDEFIIALDEKYPETYRNFYNQLSEPVKKSFDLTLERWRSQNFLWRLQLC